MLSTRFPLVVVAPVWPQKEWFTNLLSFLVEKPLKLPCCGTNGSAHIRKFGCGLETLRITLENYQMSHLNGRDFGEVVEVVASDLRGSVAALYQGKWSQFLHWYHGWNFAPCKATVQQIAKFFLYLWRELKLLVPAVQDYCAALNHVFLSAGVDLAVNIVICRILQLREIFSTM